MRPPLSAGNVDLKKGTWSPEEDQKLIAYIRRYGIWNWSEMPKAAGLSRSGKSCRLRWMNYLRPDIKHGKFTKDEEETILNLYEKLGSRWSAMAKSLPGRTDNDIKNHFNTYLRKKYLKNEALQTEVRREHQTPKLESKEMSSSSSNNLSVLLMPPNESNRGSDMEIPSFNPVREEIIHNGNQTKLGENNVGLFETCGELQSWREIEQQFSMEEEICMLGVDNQAIYSDGQLRFEESTVYQYGLPSIAATASNSTTTEGSKGIPFSPNQSTDNFPPSSFNHGSEINNNQQTTADHMMSLVGSSAEQGAPQNLCWEEPLVMEDFFGAFMYPDQMRFEDSNYPFGSYCGDGGFNDFWMNP